MKQNKHKFATFRRELEVDGKPVGGPGNRVHMHAQMDRQPEHDPSCPIYLTGKENNPIQW